MVVDDLMVIMFEFAFTRIDRRKYIFGGNYIYSSASLPSKGNKKERHFKYRSNMRLWNSIHGTLKVLSSLGARTIYVANRFFLEKQKELLGK